MIRRAFWLGAGAAAGILGYRRVTALGQRVTTRKQRHAVRGTIRFARDVREGMDLYMSRHPAPHALPSGHDSTSDRHDRKDDR